MVEHIRKRAGHRPESSHRIRPRVSLLINDNQCVSFLFSSRLAENKQQTTRKTLNLCTQTFVTSVAVSPAQNQSVRLLTKLQIKICERCFCVDQLSFVKPVTNVQLAASNLPVGARLQNYWQTWLDLGAGPKVVQILKEGYTLPFQIRPNLTRSPNIISCYVNPHRNLYLLEALHQLINKNAVELVNNQRSLGVFNRLFLVPKPNNKWRPILDLSNVNQFLEAQKFKMETPETIRTSNKGSGSPQ